MIAFRQTSHLLSFDALYLADVWDYNFDTVRGAIVRSDEHSRFPRPFEIADADDHKVVSSIRKSMLSIWSDGLNKMLQKPMSRFVTLGPQSQSHNEALKLYLERQKNGRMFELPLAEIIDLWHLLNATILASLYAVLATVLIEDGHPATA